MRIGSPSVAARTSSSSRARVLSIWLFFRPGETRTIGPVVH